MALEQIHTTRNVSLTLLLNGVLVYNIILHSSTNYFYSCSSLEILMFNFITFVPFLVLSFLVCASVNSLLDQWRHSTHPQRKEIKLLFFIKRYKVIVSKVRFFCRFSVEQLLVGGPIIRYKPRSISCTRIIKFPSA